jgi:hypothetical protein
MCFLLFHLLWFFWCISVVIRILTYTQLDYKHAHATLSVAFDPYHSTRWARGLKLFSLVLGLNSVHNDRHWNFHMCTTAAAIKGHAKHETHNCRVYTNYASRQHTSSSNEPHDDDKVFCRLAGVEGRAHPFYNNTCVQHSIQVGSARPGIEASE